MLELTPIFVLLIIFGFIYGIVFLAVRKKERMTLLEKGADPKIFHVEPMKALSLKWGLVFIGVAIGILMGNILDTYGILDFEFSYLSMIFLFGGIALVISYFLEKKHFKNK